MEQNNQQSIPEQNISAPTQTEHNISEENNTDQALDMTQYGKMAVASSSGKPQFDKNTPAVVLSAEYRISPDKKEDPKGGSYQPVYLKVGFEYTLDDGTTGQCYENYSGMRKYDDTFWLGPKSKLGMLKALLKDNFELTDELNDIPQKLKGRQVKVKTETTEYNGEKYPKIIIKSIV